MLGAFGRVAGLALLVGGCDRQAAAVDGGAVPPPVARARVAFAAPGDDAIPPGADGDTIRLGRELATHTFERLPTHVGSDLHCSSCHLMAGTTPNAGPWVGVTSIYPQYRSRAARAITIEERIDECFERSVNGSPLGHDSVEMKAFVAYMSWLSAGVPKGAEVAGRGFARLERPPNVDSDSGKHSYAARCAACHGMDGSSASGGRFFSFFLVFLVERRDAHKGAILLLDEPGLTLHPLSQEDLSFLFQNLSEQNPILYTTHSPFMVDADHLDRVRLVYVDHSGATVVTSDLRATSPRSSEGKSGYAVHAALGLSVSTALLQGCASVIVEGPSDQFYFTAMKTILVARGKITPNREILFVPAGGAKGVNAMATLVTAKHEAAPVVVLDDDKQGRQFADALKKDGPLYKGAPERILNVRDFAGGLERAEVEDLLPAVIVAEAVSRVVRGKDDDFKDALAAGRPIVPQIEAYAQKHGATLAPGWKVDLAREVKKRLLRDPSKVPDAALDEALRPLRRGAGEREERGVVTNEERYEAFDGSWRRTSAICWTAR